MRGIAGIVYPDVFQVNHLIFPMLDIYRGGAEGKRDLHTHNNVQIGMVGGSLAFNEKKTIVGGFDGNIYNIEELSGELMKQGHHLKGASAAEILIHSYELWGVKFVEKIEGDFAAMILDPLKERLILLRDRIGKKPLYWYHSNNHFLFGSQLKALLATGIIPQAPAPDALSAYLYFGYIPQDMTPIRDVNKLLPGHILRYNFNQSKTIESYWSYSSYFETPFHKHPNTIAKQLNSEIENAVKKQLPREGKIGCFVSGGLGSASVAYYLSRIAKGRELSAFTVGFEGESLADIDAASEVCKTLAIGQKVEVITPDSFLKEIGKIVWHLDEPIADPNIVATWRLAELASEGLVEVFSGMGSDELFAGHSRYTLKEQKRGLLTSLEHLKPFAYKFFVPIVKLFYRRLALILLKQSRTDPWQYEYLRQNALFSGALASKAAPKLAGLFDPEVFLHKFHHINRLKSSVSSFLYFDVKTRLADCYIHQYERLTSSFGLTWRTPYLDHQLIEFIASLPEPNVLTERETATYLKMVMRDNFPPSVVERPKRTRSSFLSKWIENPSFHRCFEPMKNGTLVETGLISREWLDHLLANEERRVENFRYLFAIYVLEVWFQLFINRPIEGKAVPGNNSVNWAAPKPRG